MGDLPDLANRTYLERINRAIDHVTRDLAQPLGLDDVARVACFSPYHFHRVFRTVMGETLHDFVKRLRLERALAMLSHPSPPTLTEVALACGFGSSSDFSRSFKARYGVPPRAFDLAAHRERGRGALMAAVPDGHRLTRLPAGDNPDGFEVRLRDLPARRVAYLRVLAPYQGTGVSEALARLLGWARARGLEGGQWLGYQWDDPELVPLDRCRYDLGLEVPAAIDLDGAADEAHLPPMKVAEVAIAGPVDLELRALDWLYTTWLPHSGFVPDHQPCFEAWDGLPFAHGTERFTLRVQIPVVAATA